MYDTVNVLFNSKDSLESSMYVWMFPYIVDH